MQQGIRQHPAAHPIKHKAPHSTQVKRPALVSTKVTTFWLQDGQVMLCGYGPRFRIFTTIVAVEEKNKILKFYFNATFYVISVQASVSSIS
jgi:hypothetical protein